MKKELSLLMITKNSEDTIEESLKSVRNLADEIIIVDDYSIDKTVTIAKKYGAHVFFRHDENLGKQKAYGLNKASGEWILILDADEIVSDTLKREIRNTMVSRSDTEGYYIPYQNYFLGRPIHYGGENYKMLRLFKKNAIKIESNLVHEYAQPKNGKIGYLKNRIHHYSYRSLFQMYRKFTDYAVREARQKIQKGEKTTLRKIFLYPPHMFWARFFKDKGYKDGWFRIPLDAGFAYMEFLTYVLMLFMRY